MTTTKRTSLALAVGATVALLAAGCAGSEAPGGLDDVQTITWWHNSTTGAAKDYYEQVANDFEKAHPGVNVEVTALEHSDMLARLSETLGSNDPEQVPDVFMSRGGGELQGEVAAGVTRDLTKVAADELAKTSQFTGDYTIDGKTYALPYSMGIVGFYYNADLFAQAGITDVVPNPTIDQFDEWVDKLQEADITPLSVGAGDKWPASHYWFYDVARECARTTIDAAVAAKSYTDPCFVKAGEDLQALVAKKPFNDGYMTTVAQQGPSSASGLLANGKVAMELAGHWEPGILAGLTADGQVPGFLKWFAYPTFPNQAGDPVDQVGGGDAWEVSTSAPDVAVDLAKYLLSDKVQQGFAALNMGLPTNPAAAGSVAFPTLKDVVAARDKVGQAPQLYLDTRLGNAVGDPMKAAIADLFAGNGSPQAIVDAVTAAANAE
ncbi:ABC transporter substrate-binding protein [Xylanimonas protaetiae]|uniref:Extracellular solute-binding protein n=1 Tax=Xylanimonas protaetiae TaxID=2509457 RepID=A0A4V0YG22_9MICO|nr:extracellular solute-binding protein [Xylanimonas protaetiae]QAY69701.1 extracellular solute-binding protein [Xylanimonas protaetiae]